MRKIAGIGGRSKFGSVYLLSSIYASSLGHVDTLRRLAGDSRRKAGRSGEDLNIIDGGDTRVWPLVKEYARRTGQRGFMLPVALTP